MRIEVEHDDALLERPYFVEVEKIPQIGESIEIPGGRLVVTGYDERLNEFEKGPLLYCNFIASV